jgi:hypothetical protein
MLMKTFLLISVMLLTSLMVESRTVPDVHIRGTDIVQPQTQSVVTVHMVEFDALVSFTLMVLTETAEPAPTFSEVEYNTLEGYVDVVNPPPLFSRTQTILQRDLIVRKFLLTDIAIVPNLLNYNFTSYTTSQSPHNYYYNWEPKANHIISLYRYPSTKARMC